MNEEELNNLNNVSVNDVAARTPETLTNTIYTPAFLRRQIGKLMRVEFLIGTNTLTDRVGILEEVGASYIILRALESNVSVFADLYAIKFINISNAYIPGNLTYNGILNNNMFNSNMLNNNPLPNSIPMNMQANVPNNMMVSNIPNTNMSNANSVASMNVQNPNMMNQNMGNCMLRQ